MRRHAAVAAVIIVGTTLAVLFYRDSRQRELERAESEFSHRAEIVRTLARERLDRYDDLLVTLRAMFSAESEVAPGSFRRISRWLNDQYPGIQGLEWVPTVAHKDRAALEAATSSSSGVPFTFTERGPDGRLVPAQNRSSYYPILYVDPMIGNKPAWGYDLKTDQTAEALERARQTHRMVVTGQISLVSNKQSGLYTAMIWPVYRQASATTDSGAFLGFVQAVLRTADVIAATQANRPDPDIDLLFVNAAEGNPARRVLYYRPATTASVSAPPGESEFRAGLCREFSLPVGDSDWRVLCRPRAGWIDGQTTYAPWARAFGALVSTGLLAGLVIVRARRTAFIEREVASRTLDLRNAQLSLQNDIRRREEVERELRESDARLRALMDNSPAAIFIKDRNGRFLHVNRQFEAVYGRPHTEIVGRTIRELREPTVARISEEDDRKVLDRGLTVEGEDTMPGPDGEHTYLIHKFPLRDAAGRIYAVCGIASDITSHKHAEQQQLAMERSLLESQKLESLGVLAGGIAHDFNNLLTAILGNANLIRLGLGTRQPYSSNVTQIETAARRAAELCQQMLAYAGKARFVITRVDLGEIVRTTTALLEVSVGKSTRIDLQLATSLPPIMADSTQLRQVVMNLVLNASDAIGTARHGLVTIATSSGVYTPAELHRAVGNPVLPAGTYVRLEVNDNGCGMPSTTLARAFEPFFTTKFSGRGLGLSVVLGIVQSHHGALFAESAEGRGTRFRLLLPATSGTAQSPASPPPASDSQPVALATDAKHTILVIDDEPSVCVLAASSLRQAGYTALETTDGDTALALLATHPDSIHLVLLDLVMPGLSGEETLQRIRHSHPTLPIVIMSGVSDPCRLEKCASLGADGFLPKPFDIAGLLSLVQRQLASEHKASQAS